MHGKFTKFLWSQGMAFTKASVGWRAGDGGKSVAQNQPSTSTAEEQQTPQFGKTMKKIKKGKMWKFHPGTRALKEIRKFQKMTELLIPKIAWYGSCYKKNLPGTEYRWVLSLPFMKLPKHTWSDCLRTQTCALYMLSTWQSCQRTWN